MVDHTELLGGGYDRERRCCRMIVLEKADGEFPSVFTMLILSTCFPADLECKGSASLARRHEMEILDSVLIMRNSLCRMFIDAWRSTAANSQRVVGRHVLYSSAISQSGKTQH